jgi:hypothetical protein
MHKKLTQLAEKAAEKGYWALTAAIAQALSNNTVNEHINVLGAMHEVGLLKNSFAPFIKVWRDRNENTFITACVQRLISGDADYWALAALLGLNISDVAPIFINSGFELLATYRIAAFKDPELHVAVIARRKAVKSKRFGQVPNIAFNPR